MSIETRNIRKNFGNFRALDGVNLQVNSGELVALLGPSGSGKTTLLRIIAGLQFADQGEVLFDGVDASDQSVRDRRVGFVFQHYALFRHMTVFENAAFGLRVMPRKIRPSKEEIKERVMRLLKLVQVDWLANQYPSQLSGGQRQRVALARALVIEPRVLLLDEPFGALDAKVRRELRRWLRRLHDEIHVTSVFVTHDQEEALEVADKVVIMDKGRIVQEGSPEEVYDHPATPFVYEFLGNVNLFHSRIDGGTAQIHGLKVAAPQGADGKEGKAYIRPQDFEVYTVPVVGTTFSATVQHISRLGPLVRLELRAPDQQGSIEVEITKEHFSRLNLKKEQLVYLSPRNVRIFATPEVAPDSLTSSQL